MSFRIHFQDVPHLEQTREECEALAGGLEGEFPETEKFEITIRKAGEEFAAHLHVVGKQVSVNSNSRGRELRDTVQEAFERAQRQLRRHHDKAVFKGRREGHKAGRR